MTFAANLANNKASLTVNLQVVPTSTVSTNPTGQLVVVDGATYLSPQSFAWTPGSIHTIGVPPAVWNGQAQNAFAGWSDGGTQTHTVTAPTLLTDTSLWTATLTKSYPIQTIVTPAGSGTVTFSPPLNGGFLPTGTPVQITATPNAGFKFVGFQGGPLKSVPVVQNFSVEYASTITATFAPAASPLLYVSPGAITLTPTTDHPNQVTAALAVHNIGTGASVGASITSVSNFTAVSGSGTVQSLSAPASLGTILPATSASTTWNFDWPPTATRVRFTVNFQDSTGYRGSTTLTLIR